MTVNDLLAFCMVQEAMARTEGKCCYMPIEDVGKREEAIHAWLLEYMERNGEFDSEGQKREALSFLAAGKELVVDFTRKNIDEILPSYKGDEPVWMIPAYLVYMVMEAFLLTFCERMRLEGRNPKEDEG